MPSPFPGMDPFIERFVWRDFHTTFNTVIRELLRPQIAPAYAARVEHRVVVERPDADPRGRSPDVAIVPDSPWRDAGGGTAVLDDRAVAEPLLVTVMESDPVRQHFVEIIDPESGRVVTVIETLSPTNKQPSGDDRREYARKRRELLRSETAFVEIDLLRGGRPFDVGTNPPAGTYRVFVSRPWRRPEAEVYPAGLLQRLPVVPVPLDESDDPVPLDLQAAVDTVYQRAGYETMNYAAELDPPLPEEARALLA